VPAAIDIGTNTVRLLVGRAVNGRVEPDRYHRVITRLGGGSSPRTGLAPEAMERTLETLGEMAILVGRIPAGQLRVVGTEALRRAANATFFAAEVHRRTGLNLEIIEGKEEALLSARGVLSALIPRPENCLIFDIGGGSTEFIYCHGQRILFHHSYPLGVVSLCENLPEPGQYQQIDDTLRCLRDDLAAAGLLPRVAATSCRLVGTAGTVTTLAAIHLGMTTYDWRRVNNLVLSRSALAGMAEGLAALPLAEREAVPGMEKGRGDLILPGVRIVLSILKALGHEGITVSDFGLLEGVLLSLEGCPGSNKIKI
jgi:exopolyphosphatase/guanosine-5'-triphosphate,3'-diphosphate pyrophosphatase